jgi:hypothetical protein
MQTGDDAHGILECIADLAPRQVDWATTKHLMLHDRPLPLSLRLRRLLGFLVLKVLTTLLQHHSFLVVNLAQCRSTLQHVH